MFGFPGGWEWIVIALIALLMFGKRLPEVMRSMGKGISEFKRGMQDVSTEMPSLTSLDTGQKSLQAPHDAEGDDFEDTDAHDGDLPLDPFGDNGKNKPG